MWALLPQLPWQKPLGTSTFQDTKVLREKNKANTKIQRQSQPQPQDWWLQLAGVLLWLRYQLYMPQVPAAPM